ncbi:MAG: septation regulator SpoVG [Natronincolaceae bacterium]|jgi:stage V sporulation protein G|nr:septation regulator SpoVG [Clostridiales bacterium]
MQVTDVRIRKITTEGKMKAIVSVTFDDEFVVHDIKIIEGQNGLFIAMPSRKMGEGDFRDIAHPINSETRNKIQDAIFTQYERMNELEREAAEAEEIEAEEAGVEEIETEEAEVEEIETEEAEIDKIIE